MCQTYAACLSLRLIEEFLCTEGDRAKYHREGNSVTQRAETNVDANCHLKSTPNRRNLIKH